MSVYFRTYNNADKLLFDATMPAYTCIGRNTVALNPAKSNYYSGLAAWYRVTFTCNTIYPPIVFVRSETSDYIWWRTPVCVASLTCNGNQHEFVIWGTESDKEQIVTYYIFASPAELSNQREGVYALWDEQGRKVFDSNYQYLIISHCYSASSNDWQAPVVTQLNSGRKYAFCNTQLSGFDDFGGTDTGTMAAIDRYQFYQDSADSVTYGLSVLCTELSHNPVGSFQNWNTSFLIADVTSIDR